MREALARSDLDFVSSEPDHTVRRGSEPARFPKILRVACISTACVVCAVIVVNALFLQDRKHQAPLLRAPDPTPVAADTVETPLPAPRTNALSTTSVKSAKGDAIADEIARTAIVPPSKATKNTPVKGDEERSDAIANLIGVTPEPNAAIMASQKALVRLGYVLRADGVFGATTRQAIERYERDNKLAVHGELTPKLSRELAKKSGVGQ